MSADERLQILQMVQDGVITVAEAESLLDALATVPPATAPDAAPVPLDIPRPGPHGQTPREAAPDMQHFRRYWEYPFIIGLIMLGVAGLCASNTPVPLLSFCGWFVFVVAGLIALVGWFSQWSPWMHVRIREHDGSRIAFSLPLPLRLAGIVADIAHVFVRRFADRETADNVQMTASFLSTLETEELDEPIMIEIVEEDGDHVRLYFG